MKTHLLEFDDFSIADYSLIGIHCTIEDYRLAFLLNLHLQTKFKRADYNLDFKDKNYNASYSVFEYTNLKYGYDWFLISNIYKSELEFEGLFNQSETKTFLIPEKKKIDFFLKIEGDLNNQHIKNVIEQINKIPQVITSYTINANKLKSKNFLIF